VAELGLCFGMPVAWMRRLPFRYELEIALEPGTRETATQGMTSNASGRYLPGPRMLAFCRTLGLGVGAYVLGSHLTPEATEVRWAPFGIFYFPLLFVVSFFLIAQADMGAFGSVTPVLFAVLAGVYWLICRKQVRTLLVPEVELAWLDSQRGR
jgi:hypothetical protein